MFLISTCLLIFSGFLTKLILKWPRAVDWMLKIQLLTNSCQSWLAPVFFSFFLFLSKERVGFSRCPLLYCLPLSFSSVWVFFGDTVVCFFTFALGCPVTCQEVTVCFLLMLFKGGGGGEGAVAVATEISYSCYTQWGGRGGGLCWNWCQIIWNLIQLDHLNFSVVSGYFFFLKTTFVGGMCRSQGGCAEVCAQAT